MDYHIDLLLSYGHVCRIVIVACCVIAMARVVNMLLERVYKDNIVCILFISQLSIYFIYHIYMCTLDIYLYMISQIGQCIVLWTLVSILQWSAIIESPYLYTIRNVCFHCRVSMNTQKKQ
jgi:hypothetical protein